MEALSPVGGVRAAADGAAPDRLAARIPSPSSPRPGSPSPGSPSPGSPAAGSPARSSPAPGSPAPGSPAATPAPASPAARRPARQRPAPRPAPVVSGEFDHLSLAELRTYRTALQAEEGNVSYWRRILQARLDVVREGRTLGGTRNLDAATLRPVLTDNRVGSGRTAFIQIMPVDDIPPLPNLGELWERQVAPADEQGLSELEQDLADAEHQLSGYRTALHKRLGAATDELVARYRVEPQACLSSLPLGPPRPAAERPPRPRR